MRYALAAVIVGALGCGNNAESTLIARPAPNQNGSTADAASNDAAVSSGVDTGTNATAADASASQAPRNDACIPLSEQTGTVVNTTHGRLDGTLVYVLPPGGSAQCNGDESHVHLQVEVSGLVYDVAVDIGTTGDEVGLYEETLAVPGGAWDEGWHGGDSLTYETSGLRSASFPTTSPENVASVVMAALEGTTKISIFCEGYTPGDNGCHDVHYENGNGKDGAIILQPTNSVSPGLFFRFQGQTF